MPIIGTNASPNTKAGQRQPSPKRAPREYAASSTPVRRRNHRASRSSWRSKTTICTPRSACIRPTARSSTRAKRFPPPRSSSSTTARGKRRKLIVAIGEIGLDYHWPGTDRDAQRVWFDAQLDLAARLGLPVIIHDRDAHGDCLDIVRAHPGLRGVFHAFSGSAETARELVRLGFHLGFGGTVTYRNATKLREVVATVPDEYLLIETDAPYLPPVPHRGEINRSALMTYTAEAIAAARGVTPDAIAELTYKNALELFNIQPANA